MKSNEIRCGNRLNAVVNNGCEIISFLDLKVSEIHKDGIIEEKGLKFPYNTLTGISLTNEWLEKLGFKKDEEEIRYFRSHENNTFSFLDKENNTFKTVVLIQDGGDYEDDYVEFECMYVHELQNLFFEINKIEL